MATVYFLELLTKMKKAGCDQEHLEVYTVSIPKTPDRTAYILGESDDSPLPYLLEAGEKLISIGADFIVIPCVTAQYFQEELKNRLSVPVIGACHELAEELKKQNVKNVAVLATSGTIKSRLIQNELEKNNIGVICPGQKEQDKIMEIIYSQVKKGLEPDMEGFISIGRQLYEKGADRVILGCTELSLLNKNHSLDKYYIDVLDVLAASAIKIAGD